MSEAKFFKSVLVELPVESVLEYSYGSTIAKQLTMEERLPNDCECTECGNRSWIIMAKESCTVVTGGKPYIECLNCGYITHL